MTVEYAAISESMELLKAYCKKVRETLRKEREIARANNDFLKMTLLEAQDQQIPKHAALEELKSLTHAQSNQYKRVYGDLYAGYVEILREYFGNFTRQIFRLEKILKDRPSEATMPGESGRIRELFGRGFTDRVTDVLYELNGFEQPDPPILTSLKEISPLLWSSSEIEGRIRRATEAATVQQKQSNRKTSFLDRIKPLSRPRR